MSSPTLTITSFCFELIFKSVKEIIALIWLNAHPCTRVKLKVTEEWLTWACLTGPLEAWPLHSSAQTRASSSYERVRGRKFLQGRDYAQFPPPPTRSLPVLHKLCRKNSRNLNLLLRSPTLQTGLCSPRVCCIFFGSSLSSFFLFFSSHVVKDGPISLENGAGKRYSCTMLKPVFCLTGT